MEDEQDCTCTEYETCPVHEGDGKELFVKEANPSIPQPERSEPPERIWIRRGTSQVMPLSELEIEAIGTGDAIEYARADTRKAIDQPASRSWDEAIRIAKDKTWWGDKENPEYINGVVEALESAKAKSLAAADFCYAEGDEGAEFCGDPKSRHCSVLGNADFWNSAAGQQHLVKCMRDDHLIHHTFVATAPSQSVEQLAREAAGRIALRLGKAETGDALVHAITHLLRAWHAETECEATEQIAAIITDTFATAPVRVASKFEYGGLKLIDKFEPPNHEKMLEIIDNVNRCRMGNEKPLEKNCYDFVGSLLVALRASASSARVVEQENQE